MRTSGTAWLAGKRYMNVSSNSALGLLTASSGTSGAKLGQAPQASGASAGKIDPSAVLHLSSGRDGLPPSPTYSNPTSRPAQKYVTFDFYSFGDVSPHGQAAGPTRLEYNVYRPDGINIDGTTTPYTVIATGESLDGAVADKYKNMLWDVTAQRIKMYKSELKAGIPLEQIRSHLQAFDRNLPDDYKALIGVSDMSLPEKRYMMPTHDETLGGEVQRI